MVFMVNILITKPNGMDLVLDQMMGWTDGGAQTPFIPFSLTAKLFRKAELKSFFNLNILWRILTYVILPTFLPPTLFHQFILLVRFLLTFTQF